MPPECRGRPEVQVTVEAVPLFVWWFAAAAALYGLGRLSGSRYVKRAAAAVTLPGLLDLLVPWTAFLYQAFTCLIALSFIVPRWRTQRVGGTHVQAVVTRGYLIGDEDLKIEDDTPPAPEDEDEGGWYR